MQQKKMNSFRCFAVYQLKQQLGEFILEHKRGCKKTFLQQRNELEGQIEKHYNIQTEKPVEFIYNCWIGIKKEVDNNTIYCLLLLHKTPDKDIFLDKLEKLFEIFIKNLKNLKDIQNIDRDQLEYQIKLMEQKYEIRGTPDGYATEEDQDEIDRNNKILQKQQQQVQQQQQQQQVQQQQKQQQQYQQQQYQQQQQQYQQQQQKQQQQQQNFQSPEKNSQQRYCNVSKSPSSTNKVREQNYQPIKLVIDNRKQSQPRVNNMDKLDYHLKFDILNSQQNIIGDGQINKEDKLINNQPMGKRRQKEKFRSSEVEIQMKESNKQKQADALIRNSIMGALASSTLALVL